MCNLLVSLVKIDNIINYMVWFVRKTRKEFIKQAIEKHGNKFDYSKVVYKTNKIPVTIICPIHGEFKQIPKNHLRYKHGCHSCSGRKKNTKNIFIKKSNKIHNNKYDYSLVDYINNKTPVIIICSRHGQFIQRPDSHISGKGCKYCQNSKGENKIKEYLMDNNINFIEQYIFKNQPKHLRRCKFDFYLPKYNFVIEYHGIQHFEYRGKFYNHFFDLLDRGKMDYEKMKFCKNNNINFFEIHYNQDIIEKLTKLAKHLEAGNSLEL